ncbi:MAG TPA: branched-chain amino acid ABC transporter substrate-binding protein [Casimicrobiaceae bacterium]|nr:branched-chain amino acid ABC transporter substrate-binding protein [Casimicrobiaceae bacterium]
MDQKHVGLGALASALSILLALPVVATQAQEVVKIGFASPLTGPQANYGKDNQNGAQLAIDELNARGTTIGGKAVKFQLQSEDDQADPKQGPLIAQKLVDAKVAGVVGHFNSGVTIPASRIYNEAGIPELSVSTNVKYTHQGFRTAFRLMADDDKQGTALGNYAVKNLKLKRLAVIDDATAYGQGLADSFDAAVKASGGQVVKHEHTNDKAVDFNALLTSIKATKPDAIFFGGYDAQAGPMARQMKLLGMNIPLMGGETMNSTKFIELAGPAAEGCIASTPGAALESRPGGKDFAARYKSRFNQDPGLYTPYFYDGVMLIAAAMKAANSTDPAKYLPALAKIRYPGVTADIEFDRNGDLTKGLLTIFEVKNGKWEVVSK